MIQLEDQLLGKRRDHFLRKMNFIFLKRIPSKVEETQSVNAVKTTEEGLFIKRLRSLIPAVEIKVDHVRSKKKKSSFEFLHKIFCFTGPNIRWP